MFRGFLLGIFICLFLGAAADSINKTKMLAQAHAANEALADVLSRKE